jgi:hypothetical protein
LSSSQGAQRFRKAWNRRLAGEKFEAFATLCQIAVAKRRGGAEPVLVDVSKLRILSHLQFQVTKKFFGEDSDRNLLDFVDEFIHGGDEYSN